MPQKWIKKLSSGSKESQKKYFECFRSKFRQKSHF
jgi:hypothetical protein